MHITQLRCSDTSQERGPIDGHDNQRGPARYWEIDAVRGSAVLAMIFYHILFDLDYLGIVPIGAGEGAPRVLALATVTTFLLIAGISLTLSQYRHTPRPNWIRRSLGRGLAILLAACLVTLVTYMIVPAEFVIFGVLHCIGCSILLGTLIIRLKRWIPLIGAVIVLLGSALSRINGPLWLLPLGIAPTDFSTLDYVPLIPWFGVFLIGMSAGIFLYPDGTRRFASHPTPPHPLGWIVVAGRHSLLIYLIHQPIVLGILGVFYPAHILGLLSQSLFAV